MGLFMRWEQVPTARNPCRGYPLCQSRAVPPHLLMWLVISAMISLLMIGMDS